VHQWNRNFKFLVKNNFATSLSSYGDMNELASLSPIGSKGLSIIPFGNGAERVLENKEVIVP
jgi:xylulokinase